MEGGGAAAARRSRTAMTGLTLVVPAFNEVDTLPRTMPVLVERAAAIDPALQVIIVDNGSTDGTEQVMNALVRSDGRLVGLRTDIRGVGSAMRTAIPHIA